MLLGAGFVFVHVMRTGGTWARWTLLRHAPPSWQLREVRGCSNHTPYQGSEAAQTGLGAVAFIRNPFDWAVSYWENERRYQGRRKHPNPWQLLPFQQAIYRMPSLWRHFCKLTDGAPRLVVGRFERLPEALPEALAELGVEVPSRVRHAMVHTVRRNCSQRGPYRDYYQPQLVRVVQHREAELLERFDYAF
jgi:hypothetical protein